MAQLADGLFRDDELVLAKTPGRADDAANQQHDQRQMEGERGEPGEAPAIGIEMKLARTLGRRACGSPSSAALPDLSCQRIDVRRRFKSGGRVRVAQEAVGRVDRWVGDGLPDARGAVHGAHGDGDGRTSARR